MSSIKSVNLFLLIGILYRMLLQQNMTCQRGVFKPNMYIKIEELLWEQEC